MNWHLRFAQQVRWTKSLRDHLFKQIDLINSRRILEVGCGTGALLQEVEPLTGGKIVGVDIDQDFLRKAALNSAHSDLILSDAHTLPFQDQIFDLAMCHFLLLWVRDPTQVITEMRRVVRSGGYVLALAEPDYGGRIDYPVELSGLGDAQRESLETQGANPLIGRQLADIFRNAGLAEIHVGLLGGEWAGHFSAEDWESEWVVIEHDLGRLPKTHKLRNADHLKQSDLHSRQKGVRILFVPTFYGLGRVL